MIILRFIICFILFLVPLVSCVSAPNETKDSETMLYKETGSPGEGYVTMKDSRNDIQSETEPSVIDQSVVADPTELRKIHNRCSDIIALCQDLLFNAETETSEYFPYETTLTQRAVDRIENRLADAGYPVINTDDDYPCYLENSEGMV